MSNKTLLSPSDVPRYTGMKLDSSPCTFRELYNIEYYEARKCLGMDFWNALIAALADYSAEPEYTAGTTYAIGDIVSFSGVYKIALVATSNVPSVAADWDNAPKFTGTCATLYDNLFCNFLAPYLAAKVLAVRLPYIWTQISDKGVVVFNGGQFETADDNGYTRLITAIHRDANFIWGNLCDYMQDNETETCFALWPQFEQTSCGCGKQTCKTCNPSKVGRYEFG